MCGIAGIAGGHIDPDVLARMGTVLAHRGPDDNAVAVLDGAGFAFRRLSIIDVAGGMQPISNEDGSVSIVLNGEIYNHLELQQELESRGHRFATRSDVETVVHLWEELGEACLERLRGMFALALWDARKRVLFLARDRVGKKPLYFARLAGGGLAFASEIKALLQVPEVPRRPHLPAIDHFLTLQYVPSPLTAFEGIERLEPAHWLRWDDSGIATQRYWRLDFGSKLELPEPELRERLLELLQDAVRVRLESEVPLGAFLSGGVDSSAVVALAAAALPRLKTFSIGFKSARHDESRYARLVAERFGTDHHELFVDEVTPELLDDIVWHYDQPFGDSSAIPSFQVARITRPHVTVVLNGDGGDECFGGYERYRLARFSPYFRLPRPLRRLGFTLARPATRRLHLATRLLQSQPDDQAEAYFATLIHATGPLKAELYADARLRAEAEHPAPPLRDLRRYASTLPSYLDLMLATDTAHYLPDDLLVKMDVATMAHSLEARSPFLDQEVLQFAAAVPARWKRRGGRGKLLLKSALKDLLPAEIIERPKMGFGVPLGDWLRTSFRERVYDSVLSERALARGYFDPTILRRLVDDHMAGSDRHQYVLWDLLQLELWHQAFIDRVPTARPAPAPASVVAG